MLAMGRALMLDPDLLILDEPSAALSPILVSSVFEQIKAINEAGKAIILVEQNAKKSSHDGTSWLCFRKWKRCDRR